MAAGAHNHQTYYKTYYEAVRITRRWRTSAAERVGGAAARAMRAQPVVVVECLVPALRRVYRHVCRHVCRHVYRYVYSHSGLGPVPLVLDEARLADALTTLWRSAIIELVDIRADEQRRLVARVAA